MATTDPSRRQVLANIALGASGLAVSHWFPALAEELAPQAEAGRHCILLWMGGGPSQTDTFDMKPQHENGGEFQEQATAVPGLRFSEHLPQLAKQADKLAIVRSLSTKEGDHGRGTYLMHTGRVPIGSLDYPAIGAALAKQLAAKRGRAAAPAGPAPSLPGSVAVNTFRALNRDAFGPGFLGPRFSPLFVAAADTGFNGTDKQGFPQLRVESLERPQNVTAGRMERRLTLWRELQAEFLAVRPQGAPVTHQTVYQSAVKLMNSDDARAFDLSSEPQAVRESYGNHVFGQGCLLARRLVERGVPFVEIALGQGTAWDTHSDNFAAVKNLSAQLDSGWATLLRELAERDLLERTTILWMGEFGRTPTINPAAGRDHFPAAWSCVLAGGGVAGGQVYGKTTADGREVADQKVSVQEVLATFCQAAGVAPDTTQRAPSGRPIPLVEAAPIEDLLS